MFTGKFPSPAEALSQELAVPLKQAHPGAQSLLQS